MKCICIAGASQPDLTSVSDILAKAGMMPPKPGNRADFIDIHAWHEQALTLTSDEALATPGRFMEQLAGDIFGANTKSDLWGWADIRSTWLLDFWLDFDPRLYFVLVYVSPEQMLANAIRSEAKPESVSAIISAWQTHYQHLLRFHLRNPGRSLLVDANECMDNPHALIQRCGQQWKMHIDTSGITDFKTVPHDPMALYLARQLCQAYPQTASLQHEVVATLLRLGEAKQGADGAQLSADQIIANYRTLRDKSVEQELLRAKGAELAALIADFDAARASHKMQQEEFETRIQHITQQSEDLQSRLATLAQEKTALTGQYSALSQELVALGQAREQELAALAQAREQERAAFAQAREQERAAFAQAREHERAAAAQAREQELAALAQAQEQELAALAHARAQDQVALVQASDQQARLVTEHQNKLKQITERQEKNLAALALQKKDAEQENELLLLQLHQVQEELEHYFLQHQDKQKELHIAETRWQRMLQRNPDYCDCESIEILPADDSDSNATHWRLKNLYSAGRSLPEIAFTTIIEHGIAGIVIQGQAESGNLLARWPANAADQTELTIIPVGSGELLRQRIETIIDLGIGDWNLIAALTGLMERTLEQPASGIVPAGFNTQPLLSGLAKLREFIENFPAMLRYDRVVLINEQVNPDYEHLWLRFDRLAMGNQHYQDFEFRLSCGNVRPGHFGHHPKLEFPEKSSQEPFEAWFIEAYDDFGAKLELRFALPEAMDIEVLQRLAENDRKFLFALITRLPAILANMQNAGVKLKRSWDDWINMASQIQRIYRLRTEAQAAPVAVVVPESVKPDPVEPDPLKTAVAKPAQRRTAPVTQSRQK